MQFIMNENNIKSNYKLKKLYKTKITIIIFISFYQNKAHILEKDQKRKQKFEDAKRKNNLLECPCCYENELLDEDMLACPDGHLFCKECVKRFTETLVRQVFSFKIY